MIEIEFEGSSEIDQFFKDIEKLGENVKRVPKRAIKRITVLLTRTVKKKISEKKLIKTGTLRRSIFPFTVDIGPNDCDGGVFTNIKYAPFLEEGTEPYPITAKNAPYLVFTLKNGEVRKMKEVKHPGIKPYHFIKESLEEIYNQIFAIIHEELDKAMK